MIIGILKKKWIFRLGVITPIFYLAYKLVAKNREENSPFPSSPLPKKNDPRHIFVIPICIF